MDLLFIGNSYTHCNRMPDMIRSLAISAPNPADIAVAHISPGGWNFRQHSENPESLDAIATPGRDIVVLQNHSLGAIEGLDEMLVYGTRLAGKIADAGAHPLLYQTWARQHTPQMIEPIRDGYVALAEKIGAQVAPVGLAWKMALERDPSLDFYTEDQSHPTATGTYLAACVFCGILLNRPSTGLAGRVIVEGETIVELDDHVSGFLQAIAHEAIDTYEQV